MEKRNLTCIVCPLGCLLTVELDGDRVAGVAGNTCPRGEAYGIEEVTNPVRMVTSTVQVQCGSEKLVSVKTQKEIPKSKIFACMKALQGITVPAPVRIGDVIVADIAGTGVDMIATKDVTVL